MSLVEPTGKSVTRTFRLDEAWDDLLETEAKSKGTSVSNLLENLVKDYFSFNKWMGVFSSVVFSPETIKAIIDEVDERALARAGESVGKVSPTHGYLIRGDELDERIARYQITEQMGRHAHWFRVSEHNDPERYYYIQHDLGPKWTAFVEAYISSFYANVLHMEVECERMGDDLLVRLPRRSGLSTGQLSPRTSRT